MNKSLLTVALLAAGCTSLFAQTTYPTGATGLIARYNFDLVTGNTMTDVSGNSHTATLTATSASTDFRGTARRALKFNGTSSYGQVAYDALLSAPNLTMIGVFKADSFNSGPCQISSIILKGTAYENDHYGFYISDNIFDGGNCNQFSPSNQQVSSSIQHAASQFSQTPGNYIQAGKWYFVAVSYNGAAVRQYQLEMDPATLYSNIVPYFTGSQNEPIVANPSPLLLGKHNSAAYPYFFNGSMDEVAIFSRVLVDSEIYSVYKFIWNQTKPTSVANSAPQLEHSAFVTGKALHLNVGTAQSFRVLVMNTAGQVVASLDNCRGEQELDLGHVSSQLVLYRISTDEGQKASGKLLLQ